MADLIQVQVKGTHWRLGFVASAPGFNQYKQEDLETLCEQAGATLMAMLLMPQHAQESFQMLRDMQFRLAEKAQNQLDRGQT